jgi:hypothetical protein
MILRLISKLPLPAKWLLIVLIFVAWFYYGLDTVILIIRFIGLF